MREDRYDNDQRASAGFLFFVDCFQGGFSNRKSQKSFSMMSSGSIPAGSLAFVVGGEAGFGFSSLLSRASSKASLMISDLVFFGSPTRKSQITLSLGISISSDRVILFLGITTWFSGRA